LAACHFHHNEEVETTICEWLFMQQAFSSMAELLNSCQERTKASVVLGITMKNHDSPVEYICYN
jgi:hypothetical protein